MLCSWSMKLCFRPCKTHGPKAVPGGSFWCLQLAVAAGINESHYETGTLGGSVTSKPRTLWVIGINPTRFFRVLDCRSLASPGSGLVPIASYSEIVEILRLSLFDLEDSTSLVGCGVF